MENREAIIRSAELSVRIAEIWLKAFRDAKEYNSDFVEHASKQLGKALASMDERNEDVQKMCVEIGWEEAERARTAARIAEEER